MALPLRPLGVALLAAGALIGCAAEAPSDPVGEELAPLVQPKVHVVDVEPGGDVELGASSITAPRDRFPELEALPAGDVIVSGKSGGILRRIRASRVEGDRVVVDTEPASLDQVFQQVHLRGALGDAEPAAAPGVGLGTRGVAIRLPKLSVDHQRLSLGANSEIELVEGSFDFSPDLDFDLVMRQGKLDRLKVQASGAAEGKLRVRYDLHVPPGRQSAAFLRSLSDGITVAEAPPYYAVFMAGWVPVVVGVHARVIASWQVTAGGDVYGEEAVAASGSLATGIEYADGRWRDLSSKSLSVSADGKPTIASHQVAGDVALTARLDVSFYDLAGPYVGLQAYAGVGHEQWPTHDGWFAELGMRGIAGAQVAVFGKALVGYEAIVFDVNAHEPL